MKKTIISKTIKPISAVLATILTLICIVMLFGGCNKSENIGPKDEPEEEAIQIGMSFDSFVIERWQRDRDVFVSTAKELGAEVNVQNANGDIEEQKRQILYFIDQGMDVIVIVCIDADSLSDEVQKAKSAGIKVIAYDRIIRNADVDLYISFDNKAVGKAMGEALIEDGLGEGSNVIMVGGSLTDYNVPVLEEGFRQVMTENNINVIDSVHCDGWRAELAYEYVYDNMDIISQADAIMCGNDNLASKLVSALAEQRLAGTIKVTGQDADLEACQRIVEGTQLMTVYKPMDALASQAAECAIKLAKGESLGETESMNDGTYDVSYISLEPIPVSREDMDEVIVNSGFHSREDVYLNVSEDAGLDESNPTEDENVENTEPEENTQTSENE